MRRRAGTRMRLTHDLPVAMIRCEGLTAVFCGVAGLTVVYLAVALMLGALAMHVKVSDPLVRSLPAFLMLAMSGTLAAFAYA